MNLVQFIETFQGAITDAVVKAYPPLYSAHNRDELGFDLRRLGRRPMGAQADAIRACALSLQRHRATNLVGEMGTGKTTIGTAAAALAGFERVLVLCPPHLVRKWQREVKATAPSAGAVIVRSISDLESVRHAGGWPLFVILSREQAKLSYRWKPAIITRAVSGSRVLRDGDGLPLPRVCCPACFAPVVDDEGVPLEEADLRRKKFSCERCRSPLWQADCHGPRRFPLADYIARRMPGFFDLLLIDEQHEYKARGSAQGLAAGTLATACGAVLTLTGTLMGGYASTLFYLLWRLSPGVREEFQYNDEPKWVSRYGIVERITRRNGDDDAYEDGRSSRRRSYRTRVVERPGVSPAVLFHLIGNTAFLRLTDVASGLPEYTEEVRLVGLETGLPGEPSQASYYRKLAGELES
ncbi:MAG: DEAD/DEAH box helicase family protein, partial [Hyphomicrobiales bacterium]